MLQPPRFIRLLLSTLAVLALAGIAARPGSASDLDQPLLQPTPLVLKDGRIAEVSIYTIPFQVNSADPDPSAKPGLDRLIDSLADDCFLTAQAIGHVEKQDTPDDDALAGHRLARARADSIQAAMVARGLPASAIASVWDWQFVVREPRVTLWVFRLDRGDDCKGKPLDRPALTASAPVAEPPPAATATPVPAPTTTAATSPAAATPPTATAAPTPLLPPAESKPAVAATAEPTPAPLSPPVTAPTAAAAQPPAKAIAAAPPEPAAKAPAAEKIKAPEAATEMLASAEPVNEPIATEAIAPAKPAAAPAAILPRAALKPPAATPAPPAKPQVAALEPQQARKPAAEASAPTPITQAPPAEALEITFDMNSSYFPDNASEQLKALAQTLEHGRSYRIELVGSVADDAVGGASGKQAEAYNHWIAERRVNRVAEYLQKNANAFSLDIRQDYAANDPSRRVVVRVRPQS